MHLRADRQGNGDVAFEWVRRSRRGWAWLSGSDTPLAEEREAYRVEMFGTGFVRAAEVASPHHVYALADQIADGAAGPIEVRVVQLGTHGSSHPTSITIQI